MLTGWLCAAPHTSLHAQSAPQDSTIQRTENPRLVSAALALTLGPFGVHRMYLGTDVRVPVFYTLSLGGGIGVLPAVDFLILLFTKDIERFYGHEGVFLWTATKNRPLSAEAGAGF